MTLEEIRQMRNQIVYYKNKLANVEGILLNSKDENIVLLTVQQKIIVKENNFKDIKYVGIKKEIIPKGNRKFIHYESVPSDVKMDTNIEIEVENADFKFENYEEPMVFKFDLSEYSREEKEILLKKLREEFERKENE